MKIKRKYDLNDNIYTEFLQKRNEAEIVKASNLSDIHFIDSAKDIGGGLIGPKTSVNYVLALFLGILIPLIIVFLLFFINNTIGQVKEEIFVSCQIVDSLSEKAVSYVTVTVLSNEKKSTLTIPS